MVDDAGAVAVVDNREESERGLGGLQLETSCYMVQGTTFEVDKRYEIIEPISHGAYGLVCAAEDRRFNERVAVKKMESVFEHVTIAKRTLREFRILHHLQHENIMMLRNIFVTGGRSDFDEVYVVSDLMETDLAQILRSEQPLSDDHCRFFLYQLLRGMKYVHSAEVLHRDLKPRNLLVNSNCDLKICGFGLARARFLDKAWCCPMTEYVCTRWYRAPEVLCSSAAWTNYSRAVDVWSIGCVLAEMYVRRPLFPGSSTQHQLDLIIRCLGPPRCKELRIRSEKCRRIIEALPEAAGASFEEAFEAAFPAAMPAEAKRLMGRMIRWDPDSRATVAEALEDPCLEYLHCPEDEPVREPLDTSDFEFERRRVTIPALREELFHEALCYYPHLLGEVSPKRRQSEEIMQCGLLTPREEQLSEDEELDSGDEWDSDSACEEREHARAKAVF